MPETWQCPVSIPAAIKAALPEVVASYQAALVPAKHDFVLKQLMQLALLFNNKRSDIEWKAVFTAFADDLQEFPMDIITEVIKRHRRNSSFFPSIAELYGPACELLLTRETELQRAQALLSLETDDEWDARRRHEIDTEVAESEQLGCVQPWHRIWIKYSRHPRLRIRHIRPWLALIHAAISRYGARPVVQWHADLVLTDPDDPLEQLQKMATAHEAAVHQAFLRRKYGG